MIVDSYINKEEEINILQKYFSSSSNFNKFYKLFQTQRTKEQIKKHLKNKIKTMILQLQSQLCSSNAIKQMKFYDYCCDELFDHFFNLTAILSSQAVHDFLQKQKSSLYKFDTISLQKRINIYQQLINYAERQKLFDLAILEKEADALKGPFQNPENIYSPSELQLIFIIYDICNGKDEEIEQKLKNKGYVGDKFQKPLLIQNLRNLELIGLFRCYKKSVQCRGCKGKNWQAFIKDQQDYRDKMYSWSTYLMVTLMKIATKNNGTVDEIRSICWKLGRSYFEEVRERKKRKVEINYSQQRQEEIIEKYKEKLQQILKRKQSNYS